MPWAACPSWPPAAAGLIHATEPAADILRRIVDEAERALRAASSELFL